MQNSSLYLTHLAAFFTEWENTAVASSAAERAREKPSLFSTSLPSHFLLSFLCHRSLTVTLGAPLWRIDTTATGFSLALYKKHKENYSPLLQQLLKGEVRLQDLVTHAAQSQFSACWSRALPGLADWPFYTCCPPCHYFLLRSEDTKRTVLIRQGSTQEVFLSTILVCLQKPVNSCSEPVCITTRGSIVSELTNRAATCRGCFLCLLAQFALAKISTYELGLGNISIIYRYCNR